MPLTTGNQFLPPSVGLPGQVIGSGVDHVVVLRVEGNGVKTVEVRVIVRSDLHPACAFVFGAVDARERASEEKLRVGWRLREGANGFVSKADDVPATAAVVAAVNAAAAGIERPATGVQAIRIARVDDDVRDDIVLARADTADHLPVLAFVGRGEDMTVGAPQKERARRCWGQRPGK